MTQTNPVRELDDYGAEAGGSACLVQVGDAYYVISSIPSAPDHGGPETLAFAADSEGEVSDWGDVAGGRGWTREQTIAELESVGPDAESGGRGMFGDTKPSSERDAGEVLDALVSTLDVVAKGVRK